MYKCRETYYRRAKARISQRRGDPRQSFFRALREYEDAGEELTDVHLKTWASDSSQYRANLLSEYAYLHLKAKESRLTSEDFRICRVGLSALHERMKKKTDSNDIFIEDCFNRILGEEKCTSDLLKPLFYRFEGVRSYPIKADIYRNSSNQIETVVFYRKSRSDDYLSFHLCAGDFFGYVYSYTVTCKDSIESEHYQTKVIRSVDDLKKIKTEFSEREYHALFDEVPVKVSQNYMAELKNDVYQATSLLHSISKIIVENRLSITSSDCNRKYDDLEELLDQNTNEGTIQIVPIIRASELWLSIEETRDCKTLTRKTMMLTVEDEDGNSVGITEMYRKKYHDNRLRLSWLEHFSADIE